MPVRQNCQLRVPEKNYQEPVPEKAEQAQTYTERSDNSTGIANQALQ